MLKIGLDTESLHLWLQNKKMDIIGFIETAHEFGLDGVMINLIKDYNLDPQWGSLGSDSQEHLERVRQTLQEYNMYVELATKGLEYEHLLRVIQIADTIGADIIRTYIPITLNSQTERSTGGEGRYDLGKVRLDFEPSVFDDAVISLKKIIPILKKYRIKLALENHEYETSMELVRVIEQINSPWIGLHYDFGNAMMAWEQPVEAAKNMAPYTITTHFKDHIVIPCPDDTYQYVVCGVPAGQGNIDLKECLRIMMENSQLTRLNVEMCYPYCA
ncbi:MAG: sugar phosphate isomerase/epimerase family protein [Ruthenibacterium sp.]